MRMELTKEYKKELKDLRQKMIRAQEFAEKMPVFAKEIIERKFNATDQWLKFEPRYKSIYFAWGINRGLFVSSGSRTVSNYNKEYNKYLFTLYINTYNLFDTHNKCGLEDVPKKAPVFFYDKLNSTFYATDEQITDLLEELNKWYLNAKEENRKIEKERELFQTKKRLAELEKEND